MCDYVIYILMPINCRYISVLYYKGQQIYIFLGNSNRNGEKIFIIHPWYSNNDKIEDEGRVIITYYYSIGKNKPVYQGIRLNFKS